MNHFQGMVRTQMVHTSVTDLGILEIGAPHTYKFETLNKHI